MKRIMILLAGVLFLFSVTASVFAAEQSPENNAPAVNAPSAPAAPAEAAPAVVKKEAVHKTKIRHMRATHMRTYGKVMAVSETALKIERTVKGTAETMDFSLEKPANVKIGEMVRVRYVEKDGKKVVLRVAKAADRHKKAAKKEK